MHPNQAGIEKIIRQIISRVRVSGELYGRVTGNGLRKGGTPVTSQLLHEDSQPDAPEDSFQDPRTPAKRGSKGNRKAQAQRYRERHRKTYNGWHAQYMADKRRRERLAPL